MRNILILFLFTFFYIRAEAQNFEYHLTDASSVYQEGVNTIMSPDSNLVVLGGFGSFIISKITMSGSIIWSKNFYSSLTSPLYGNKIINTSDNGFLLCGYGFTSPTNSDILVLKLDSVGDIQWSHELARGISNVCKGAIELADSSFIITGCGNSHAFVGKLDKNGNVVWIKVFTSFQQAEKIITTIDGGYAIFITEHGQATWFLKYDSNDSLDWVKTFITTSPNNMFLYDFIQTEDKGYAFAGSFMNQITTENIVIKIDGNGNIIWKTIIDASNNDGLKSIVETADNGFLVCGDTAFYGNNGLFGCGLIARLDSAGTFKWAEYTNDSSKANSILKLPDDLFLITGSQRISNLTGDVLLSTITGSGIKCGVSAPGGSGSPCTNVSLLPLPLTQPQLMIFTDTTGFIVSPSFTTLNTICVTTLVSEIAVEEQISIWPNPSSGMFHMKFINDDERIQSIVIRDMVGKVVYRSAQNNNEVDITNAKSGIYFFEITSERNDVFRGEIIKQ